MDKVLHGPAMERLRSGVLSVVDEALEKLAAIADESGANDASTTVGFTPEDEVVEAKYIPEVRLVVRRP